MWKADKAEETHILDSMEDMIRLEIRTLYWKKCPSFLTTFWSSLYAQQTAYRSQAKGSLEGMHPTCFHSPFFNCRPAACSSLKLRILSFPKCLIRVPLFYALYVLLPLAYYWARSLTSKGTGANRTVGDESRNHSYAHVVENCSPISVKFLVHWRDASVSADTKAGQRMCARWSLEVARGLPKMLSLINKKAKSTSASLDRCVY